jgi:hypothetical protein
MKRRKEKGDCQSSAACRRNAKKFVCETKGEINTQNLNYYAVVKIVCASL